MRAPVATRPRTDDADKDSAVMAGLSSVIERQGATERLATELARADLKLEPAEFVALWIAIALRVRGGVDRRSASSSRPCGTRWRWPCCSCSACWLRATTFATARASA